MTSQRVRRTMVVQVGARDQLRSEAAVENPEHIPVGEMFIFGAAMLFVLVMVVLAFGLLATSVAARRRAEAELDQERADRRPPAGDRPWEPDDRLWDQASAIDGDRPITQP